MHKRLILGVLILILGAGLAWSEDGQWLHMRIEEDGSEGDKVSLNLPLNLVEAVIQHVDHDVLSNGRVILDDQEFDRELIVAILEATREEGDVNYLIVEGVDENITISKRGEELLIKVREDGEDDESVDIQIPLSVVEALLQTEGDELDLVAGLRELGKQEGSTLVTIKDDEDNVRIWVDSSAEGI